MSNAFIVSVRWTSHAMLDVSTLLVNISAFFEAFHKSVLMSNIAYDIHHMGRHKNERHSSPYFLFHHFTSFPQGYWSCHCSNDHITIAMTKLPRSLRLEAKHVWLLSLRCSKCPLLLGAFKQCVQSHAGLLLRQIHPYIAYLYNMFLCTVNR